MGRNIDGQRIQLALFNLMLAGEQEAFDTYKGSEETLSVGYVGNGNFVLRAHDNTTRGGLKLFAEGGAAGAIVETPVPPYIPEIITDGALPTAIPPGTTDAFLDFDLSTSGTLDLAGYAPTGLAEGATVRFRKLDTGPNGITFTDPRGVNYNYVLERGEVLTLVWFSTAGGFRLV